MNYLYIGIIVVILFFVFWYQKTCVSTLLDGVWEADRDFCDEAGLNLMTIYFEEEKWGKRSCYILAQNTDDDVVINEPTSCRISFDKTKNWSPGLGEEKTLNIEFDEFSENYSVFPQTQSAKFYPSCGKLIMYSGDTITGILYKNSAISDKKTL